jgi:hypothetical protein
MKPKRTTHFALAIGAPKLKVIVEKSRAKLGKPDTSAQPVRAAGIPPGRFRQPLSKYDLSTILAVAEEPAYAQFDPD